MNKAEKQSLITQLNHYCANHGLCDSASRDRFVDALCSIKPLVFTIDDIKVHLAQKHLSVSRSMMFNYIYWLNSAGILYQVPSHLNQYFCLRVRLKDKSINICSQCGKVSFSDLPWGTVDKINQSPPRFLDPQPIVFIQGLCKLCRNE